MTEKGRSEMRLQDRVVLVIGGASGIGRATAEVCALQGAKVVVSDINKQGAEAVADTISKGGGVAIAASTDITDESVRRRHGGDSGRPVRGSTRLGHERRRGRLGGRSVASRHRGVPQGPVLRMPSWGGGDERSGGGSMSTCRPFLASPVAPPVRSTRRGTRVRSMASWASPAPIALAYATRGVRANAVCPGYIRTGADSIPLRNRRRRLGIDQREAL